MRRQDNLLIGGGILIFTLSLLLMAFYVAWVLLPVVLALIILGFIGNVLVYLYRRYFSQKREPVHPRVRKNENLNIIDAEYEIIDDNKKH